MARARQTAMFFAALFFIPALSADAQVSLDVRLHGSPLVSSLYAQLSSVGGYSFEKLSRVIHANDQATGERIFTISHPEHGALVLDGTVMRLTAPSFELRRRIHREIETFNSSAAVGTMYYDEAAGVVRLEHILNPALCSVPAIAAVAGRFGHAVRTGRGRLAAIEVM